MAIAGSRSRVGLRLRLWGRRGLATWLCLLRTWAEQRRPVAPEVRSKNFLADNRKRQEELRRIFTPYYRFCPACGSQCCREAEIPYSALDEVLYGLMARPVRDREKRRWGYFSCLQRSYLGRKLKRFAPAEGARPYQPEDAGICRCPALTAGGCSLPWGERPAVCVFCACPQILAEMSWPEFGHYVWANFKYLSYLSRAVAYS